MGPQYTCYNYGTTWRKAAAELLHALAVIMREMNLHHVRGNHCPRCSVISPVEHQKFEEIEIRAV